MELGWDPMGKEEEGDLVMGSGGWVGVFGDVATCVVDGMGDCPSFTD